MSDNAAFVRFKRAGQTSQTGTSAGVIYYWDSEYEGPISVFMVVSQSGKVERNSFILTNLVGPAGEHRGTFEATHPNAKPVCLVEVLRTAEILDQDILEEYKSVDGARLQITATKVPRSMPLQRPRGPTG